ncbi:apolipoprotein L3 isoform X2 [Trachinotus anak]|uniref:apolipoprotein L3 isoform X2 n=1 Tax=Trachinotus anak TaxID=443729 RepID=UPI0039F1E50B
MHEMREGPSEELKTSHRGEEMSTARKELQEALCRYTTDTLSYIDTVRGFCGEISKWVLRRETELNMMMNIKTRADKLDLSFNHVTQSEEKGKAFLEYMKSKVTQVTADSRRAELEKELAAVLKDTLRGLEKLDCFLDAVENLAVTSLHVFMENQVLHLPAGISLEHVQVVISTARLICPLLLEFKRDAQVFFLPRLQNVEVLSYQLDRYIQTTQKICDQFEKSSFSEFCQRMTMETLVNINVDLFEDDIWRMIYCINQLDEIRMNQHFRTVFLFQEESCSDFISEFNDRHPRMLQFLNELEETAVQLDRMNKGAKISSVAGSSVGAVGGVLSIVGLALIPVTAGVSLALTMTGVGLGITSGVNSAVTTATEIGVNRKQQKKASEVFMLFMEDVQSLQDCLEKVTSQAVSKVKSNTVEMVVGVGKVLCKAGVVGKGIDSFVDAASAVKLLKSEELIGGVGKVVVQEGKALRNVPRAAADIPDIGQAAVKGPLALSKSARAGFIALNALFLGMDIFFICKDSISLAKGSETEVSQFIRARAALWSSEIESWEKICNSLCKSLSTSEKKRSILETPFYP